jgi:hypothetical protein
MKNTVFALLLFLIPFSGATQVLSFIRLIKKIGVCLNEKPSPDNK